MTTLITAVEELLWSKKSQQKYSQEEIDRITRQMAQNQYEIDCLKRDLTNLKGMAEPRVPHKLEQHDFQTKM